MRMYLSLFKIKLINELQYRTAALAGISTQFFFGAVFIMVYLAFYESNTGVSPMKVQELVCYLWLNQSFFALVYTWIKNKELLSMIKNGNIAYELCRPVNFFFKWLATLYGARIATVALRFFPVLLFAFLLPSPYNMTLPPSLLSFILFLIALIISSILVNAICYLFHIITFFILDEKGVMTLLMVISEIFSGGTIPLVFFPKILYKIAYLLPFRYIADLPFRIYSGNISVLNALPDIVGGIVWIIVILVLGYFLTSRALKKAIIQGG